MTFIIEPFIVVVSIPVTNHSQTQGGHSETTLRRQACHLSVLVTQPRDQVLLFLPSKTIPIFGFLLSPPSLPTTQPKPGLFKTQIGFCHSAAQYPCSHPGLLAQILLPQGLCTSHSSAHDLFPQVPNHGMFSRFLPNNTY